MTIGDRPCIEPVQPQGATSPTSIQGQPWAAGPPEQFQIPQWTGTQWDFVANRSAMFVLASLRSGAAWFPYENVGPYYEQSSYYYIASPYNASGFCHIPRTGILCNFSWSNAGAPYENTTVDLWRAYGGIPSTLAYSGISLTMPAGSYHMHDNGNTLFVSQDDLIFFNNSSYTVSNTYVPGSMMITAQFIPII